MTKHLKQLAEQRLELIEKIEAQRMEVTEISARWRQPLAIADIGTKALHLVYRHPALIAGLATALLTWRRNGIAGLAKNGWRLLYLYPSAIFFGLKYVATITRLSKEKRD